MNFQIRTKAEVQPSKGEKNFQPSMTIPDQTLSIMEIMQRHAQGLPIGGEKVPVYNGEDEDLPDFRKMDLADIQEWKEQAAENTLQLQQQLQQQQQDAVIKKQQADIKKQQATQNPKKGEKNQPEDAEIIE